MSRTPKTYSLCEIIDEIAAGNYGVVGLKLVSGDALIGTLEHSTPVNSSCFLICPVSIISGPNGIMFMDWVPLESPLENPVKISFEHVITAFRPRDDMTGTYLKGTNQRVIETPQPGKILLQS